MKFEQIIRPKSFTPAEEKELNASREGFQDQVEKEASAIRESSPFYKRLIAEKVDPMDVTRVYAELEHKYRATNDFVALKQLEKSDMTLSKVKTNIMERSGEYKYGYEIQGELAGNTVEGTPCKFVFTLWSRPDSTQHDIDSLEAILGGVKKKSEKSVTTAIREHFNVVDLQGSFGNDKLKWAPKLTEDAPAEKVLCQYFGVAADKHVEIYKLWQEKLEKMQSAIDEINADPLIGSELYNKLKIAEKFKKITEQFNKLKPYLNATADTFDFFGNITDWNNLSGRISEGKILRRTLPTVKERE